MKAEVDDLVIWSSNSNWKLGIGIVYAIHGERPYVVSIESDGNLGRKQEIGGNYLVIRRYAKDPAERLVQAESVWLNYLGQDR